MVFVASHNIYSPLGTTSLQNYQQLLAGVSGIGLHENNTVHSQPFCASLFKEIRLYNNNTKFEQVLINSIADAIHLSDIDASDPSTAIVISTTKGNIGLLENAGYSENALTLHYSAKKIGRHFNNPNKPLVVSNACISGLSAVMCAKRMIEAGQFKNVIVAGGDIISKFVFSGFNAFHAISPQPCKPFDAGRNGVTLGEAAGCIILSSEKNKSQIQLAGGAGSNDANHISGPSRTGEELALAMQKAMKEAGVVSGDINYISAHGTATMYNDEMEAKAIHLAGLQQVPVNSLKGYYGHTLGAAGIIESVITMQCMLENTILPSAGFQKLGVSLPLAVNEKVQKTGLKHSLKSASGFGGCNAVVVWSKL